MPGGKHRVTLVWSAAIFIGLEIAAIAMLRSSSAVQDIWINRSSHKAIALIWGGTRRVSEYLSLRDKNSELARENAALMARIQELEEKERPCIPANADKRYSYTLGRIVKMSLNTNHNYIIIDKGLKDGIEADCGIVTPSGVVGTISSVSNRYSFGMTMMNPRTSVSARLGRGGVVSPLRWDGIHTDRAILEGIPMKYEVNPGDTVWTSGFSTLFPPDIPIGTVIERKSESGESASASIELFQDFAKLDYVLIVKNLDADEISELESNCQEGRL